MRRAGLQAGQADTRAMPGPPRSPALPQWPGPRAPALRLKDTHGQHLALQRLRADPAAGALQQLPQPLDSHAAGPLLNLETGAPSAGAGTGRPAPLQRSPSPCSRNSPRRGRAGTLPGRTWPPSRNARLHRGTGMQWEERGHFSPKSEERRGRRKPPNVPPGALDAPTPPPHPRTCKTHANWSL